MQFKKTILFSVFAMFCSFSQANTLEIDFNKVDLSSHTKSFNNNIDNIPHIGLEINTPLNVIYELAKPNNIKINAYLNPNEKLTFDSCSVDSTDTDYNLPFYYNPSILHSKIIKCKNIDGYILDFIVAKRDFIDNDLLNPAYSMTYEIISPYYKPFYGEKDDPVTSVYDKTKFEIRKESTNYGIGLDTFFDDKGLLFY